MPDKNESVNMESPPLEFWDAETFYEVYQGDKPASIRTGRTKPLRISAFRRVDGQKQTKQFLTKSVGHPEITNWHLISELLGNQLAQHFEVQTAPPAIIRFSDLFVNTVRASPKFQEQAQGKINLQSGYAAGSEFLPGITHAIPSIERPTEQQWARRLFAYDMMVQNPDRKTDNPNAAMLNGEVVAFDFELCFSFVRLLSGMSGQPWEVDEDMAKGHLFYKGLWAKPQDWECMTARFDRFSCGTMEQVLGDLLDAFPPSTPSFADKVLRHMSAVKSNAAAFCTALDRNLR